MRRELSGRTLTLLAGLAFCAAATSLHAQAWHYPAFQPPEIATREFNFGVAGGGDLGTSGIAQWREGISPDAHAAFDLGFASPSGGGNTLFLLGGAIGQRLLRSTPQTPLDLILTAGIYGGFSSNFSVLRIPVGVSVGHRFPLTSGGIALIPYVHPRLSLDVCGRRCSGTSLNVNFDIGADYVVTRTISLRGALTVGGVANSSSETAFGLSLAVHPGVAAAPR